MQHFDHIIIGGGPGGIQLGYSLHQLGFEYVVLERNAEAGSFFNRYPRHRRLISVNKVHTAYDDPDTNLRWDWNSLLQEGPDPLLFKEYSQEYFPPAEKLVTYINDLVERYGLNVHYGQTVRRISKPGAQFHIETTDGRLYSCERAIVATGQFKPFMPPIPGIEHAESYTTISDDPSSFTGERVLIIGKGNTGFETAELMLSAASTIHLASPHSMTLACDSHYPGNVRAVNTRYVDSCLLSRDNVMFDAAVRSIERAADGKLHVALSHSHQHGPGGVRVDVNVYDRVVNCTGFEFDTSIFAPDCSPQLEHQGRSPAMTDAFESKNVEGLFFAGALTKTRDFRQGSSAFIHGFRYNSRALARIFAMRRDGRWPIASASAFSVEALSSQILRRCATSSGLWHLFGVMHDVVFLDDHTLTYMEELPTGLVNLAPELSGLGRAYTLTLEYSHGPAGPFQQVALRHAGDASHSVLLHPVVRGYLGGRQVSEYHVHEDYTYEFSDPKQHVKPLEAFFRADLAGERRSGSLTGRCAALSPCVGRP